MSDGKNDQTTTNINPLITIWQNTSSFIHGPIYPLWRHHFERSGTALSTNLHKQGEEIFQTIPEWAQFSQGNWRNGQKNHVTLTWKSPWKACSITHLPFWAPNSKMMKGFSETLPTKIKPTKCPASSKKNEAKKEKREGRRESEKWKSKVLCFF